MQTAPKTVVITLVQHYEVEIISIFHGCMVWIEKSVTRVTDRHHEACRVMPNSDPEWKIVLSPTFVYIG